MANEKIIIVEDQSVISTNIRLLLKFNNYEVLGIASTANECFQMIEKEIPDLILMDISLPGTIDGIEATKTIKEKWNIPVIYLTARTDEPTLQRAKETEPYGYITKDVELKFQLPILVEFAIYKHKMAQDNLKAQIELKESEEKFRSIVTSARDAIIFIDNDGKVSYWNDAATDIFGYTEEEALGNKLYKLIAPEAYEKYYKMGFTDFAVDGIGDFTGRAIELDAKKKNQDVFPIEVSLSTLILKEKWCACAIIRDFSARKTIEDEMSKLIEELQLSRELIEQHANELIRVNSRLTESEESLKELNVNKDKFFSIISHDLKGPFQGLLGYSEVLSQAFDSLTKDEVKEITLDLHSSAQHLFKLLENLLHWSRIQLGAMSYDNTNFQVTQLVKMSINIVISNANQKKISLINDVPDEVWAYADVNMIHTVLRNLLSNAIKFTKIKGKVTVSAKQYDEKNILLSVADDGIGIEPEDIDKMFRIDTHHSTAGTANEKGTGLGLILCKELVEKNDGKIWLESNVNVGTTFYFTLPVGKNI